MPVAALKVVAPVSRPEEVALLIEAGADEIYCGVLPSQWRSKYGDWDSLNRRQGIVANLPTVEGLQAIASIAGSVAALALNQRYTEEQIPQVLEIAELWAGAGGRSVLVSDPGILLLLKKRHSGLLRHLSLLATCLNSATVQFFQGLGVSRVVLPRSLSLPEIREVSLNCPDIEFEVMALNEDCKFIDGLCAFYHGTSFPDGVSTTFGYERAPDDGLPRSYTHDLTYAGHACELPFRTGRGGLLRQRHRDDLGRPRCAACALGELALAGVGFLKVGGRGLPLALKLRAVRFLREVVSALSPCVSAVMGIDRTDFSGLYARVFGSPCDSSDCYYSRKP